MKNMPKVEKKVGAEDNCETCNNKIICRMTTYKGGYDNYPQWQNIDENKAHYTASGKCKGITLSQSTNQESTTTRESPASKSSPKLPVEMHSACWNFALMEATNIYPIAIKGGNLAEVEIKIDTNLTARMILAQVFYKKNMDYMIHGGL